MTEERVVQSTPASHCKWRRPRFPNFGFLTRNASGRFSKSEDATRTNGSDGRGWYSTKDKKTFLRRGTTVKDGTARVVRNDVLLMFSGIRSSGPSCCASLDCGETVSISNSNSEESDYDRIMASHRESSKISPLGTDDSTDSHPTDLSSSASSLDGAHDDDDDDDDIHSFASCDEHHEELNTSSSSIRVVRFADEEGLPMEDICHLMKEDEDGVMDRNHYEELIVLILSPHDRKFEFLHVGYFPQANIEEMRRATTVRDLLQDLPRMVTNPLFQHATFDALYRSTPPTTEGGQAGAQLIPASDLLLRDCYFRENETVIATMVGSCQDEVLRGVGPLLENAGLMKRVRRGRRSGRGLKLVRDEAAPQESTTKRRSARTRGSPGSGGSDLETSSARAANHLMDENGDEPECANLKEAYRLDDEETISTLAKFLQAAVMISAGTIFFSAMGI